MKISTLTQAILKTGANAQLNIVSVLAIESFIMQTSDADFKFINYQHSVTKWAHLSFESVGKVLTVCKKFHAKRADKMTAYSLTESDVESFSTYIKTELVNTTYNLHHDDLSAWLDGKPSLNDKKRAIANKVKQDEKTLAERLKLAAKAKAGYQAETLPAPTLPAPPDEVNLPIDKALSSAPVLVGIAPDGPAAKFQDILTAITEAGAVPAGATVTLDDSTVLFPDASALDTDFADMAAQEQVNLVNTMLIRAEKLDDVALNLLIMKLADMAEKRVTAEIASLMVVTHETVENILPVVTEKKPRKSKAKAKELLAA